MALIDRDFRVFGRVNVIDAVALVLATGIVLVALVAYRAVQTRPLEITAVRPHQLPVASPARVRIEGTSFRPFLEGFVTRAGRPFVVKYADESTPRATAYLLESPVRAELEFPALAAGDYDLYVVDHGLIVARSLGALTVGQPDLPLGVRTMKVQFYPPPQAVPLIRVGDKDLVEPRLPTSPIAHPAVVTAVEPRHEVRRVIDMRLTDEGVSWMGQPIAGELVDVTLRVPQFSVRPGVWTYNEAPVRVGALFTLTTERYQLRGFITWIGDFERIEQNSRKAPHSGPGDRVQ